MKYIKPIWDLHVDRLSARALLILDELGTSNNRTVGNWAMQKEGEAGMKELHNIVMTLEKPENCIGSHFGSTHVGIITEFFDIALGLNPGNIHKEWKFYNQWRTEPDGRYPYTYGAILHNMMHPTARYGFSQWDHTISKLKRTPNTRHAGMFCWDIPCHERDFVPCTYGFHFQYIEDKLCLTTMMRSQDALKGWYLDCFLYSHLLMMMSAELETEIGTYSVFQNNFHVYPTDFDDLDTRINYYMEKAELDPIALNGSQCGVLTTKDKEAITVALDYLYTSIDEGKGIYKVHPLNDIRSTYFRALVALIYAKYTDIDLSFYVNENDLIRNWYNNIRSEK